MEAAFAERGNTFFRFEDLRIYHKAQDYIKWVSETSGKVSVNSNDNLLIKFNDSARSIAVNIAEGSARNKSQFIYYLKMAKSSVRECLVYTSNLKNLDAIDDDEEQVSRNYLMEMTKMIGALISSLQRGQSSSRERYDDDDGHGNTEDHPVENQIHDENY
jgi:four helix bundle protein